MTWTSKYFTSEEMACSASGIEKMDPGFMRKLDSLRREWGKPMIVTSAYRDPEQHPIEAAKANPGAHAYGRAADIALRGEDAYEFLKLAMAYFPRVGVNQKGSARFIHIDDMEPEDGFPSPHIWSY